MKRTRNLTDSSALSGTVIEGMRSRKGKGIISMDFRNIKNAMCDYFVICHGTSRVQVESLAEGIEEVVRETLGYKPWHREGMENAEWILLDYVDVVVHVFQEQTRDFYQLEDLWADAAVEKFESVD
jgi:ribosome-associated protein